jgi:tRNA pseudouridine55 synthase
MATGVLVLGVNRATRLLGHLMLTEKSYAATVRLGVSTTTDDAEGEVVETCSTDALTEQAVRAAFATQVGELDQVPSSVSAIKVEGKRAYQRVREGEDVALSPRRVTVHELTVTELRTGKASCEADIEVRCSSGTYIRAIARDVGAALGVGGHLTALRRTTVGAFGLAQARTLDELTESLSLVPIAEAARAAFPSYDLDERQAADVRFGRGFPVALPTAGPVAVFAPDGEFLALYEQQGDHARAVAVFVG